MKTLLLSILVSVSALSAAATGYSYMAFTTTDGEALVVSSTGLTITFTDENLSARTANDNLTIPLSKLVAMQFSSDAIGGGLGSISSVFADTQACTVYSIDGSYAGEYSDFNALSDKLPAGIYILKGQNGKICKIYLSK